MSDLIERLKEYRFLVIAEPTSAAGSRAYIEVEWCKEAAEEILRLRAENERLSEKAAIGEYMWTPAELSEAIVKARNEALEEAAKVAETAQISGSLVRPGVAAAIRSLKDKESGD